MQAAPTYLDRILAEHREAAATDTRDLDELTERATAMAPPRGFRESLLRVSATGRVAVIAEVKRRSPSKGDLAPNLDPATLARQYAAGGAACLSVLTDRTWFGGSPDDLMAARTAVELPVLRKDFTVSERDVCDARLMGADAVLLIAAALSADELHSFHALALDLGLDPLVEIHDEAEMVKAMAVGATLVGVNQRDLVTFEVDTERALRVGAAMPDTMVRVAESGISAPSEAEHLRAAGFHAVLVGESLVTAPDPAAAVKELGGGAARP